MKKRVCENCRFFLEAGFAKNGWCNNPQRKETSDVILVVRKNELACRGTWANDLFVPRTADDSIADIVLHDSKTLKPLAPARVEEVTFLVNGHRDRPQANHSADGSSAYPVDVVVGQMPATNPAADRAPLMNHDNRSAILKARERHRQRLVTEKRHIEPVGLSSESVDDIDVVASHEPRTQERAPVAPLPTRTPRHQEVPPVQRSEIPREFPTMTSFPEDDARFLSVPEPVAGFELPRRNQPMLAEPLVVTDERFTEEVSGQDSVMSYATTRRDPDRNAENIAEFARDEDASNDVMMHSDGVIEFDSEYRSASADVETDDGCIGEQVPIYRSERRRFDFSGWRRGPRPQAVTHDDVYDDFEVQETVGEWIDESVPVSIPVTLPAEDYVLAQFEAYEESEEPFEIAPEVPRMCRTCRDFRPADSGERGWCTNRWAFVHSRMVDAEELPCETSVGVWWLPHDDVWLATADFSSHSQPTPLVDLWLSRTVQDDTEMVGERRRKRS